MQHCVPGSSACTQLSKMGECTRRHRAAECTVCFMLSAMDLCAVLAAAQLQYTPAHVGNECLHAVKHSCHRLRRAHCANLSPQEACLQICTHAETNAHTGLFKNQRLQQRLSVVPSLLNLKTPAVWGSRSCCCCSCSRIIPCYHCKQGL